MNKKNAGRNFSGADIGSPAGETDAIADHASKKEVQDAMRNLKRAIKKIERVEKMYIAARAKWEAEEAMK